MHASRALTAFLLCCPLSLLAAEPDTASWTDLTKQIDLKKQTVAGNWKSADGGLTTDAARGARLRLARPATAEYDFRVRFTRNTGVHSIALFFPAGTGQGSFEVDAWGEHLAGLQMINGRSLRENPTRSGGHTLENGKAYTAMVQVRKGRIRAYLNDRLLADYETDGADLSVPDLWRMPDRRELGIGAWDSATTFHSIEVRPVGDAPLVASRPTTTSANTRPTRPPATRPMPTPRPRPSTRPSGTTAGANAPRVLIVIANQDFFYREYADPRQELERAGIRVEVAAGRKAVCRPHANSGQQGSGEVMPDLAIADADVDRYDAIMFSGGWGSSMYQYAFRGTYANRAYNGDPRTRAAVNKLLNEFIEQDKYVGALCHGVSVLAWARVDNRSILEGKRAVASPRQSPAGVYNGRRDQPLSRWNAEVNGARLTPARSIGDPRTSADDVTVDGKILTGEDDNSARLFGSTLARLLTGK